MGLRIFELPAVIFSMVKLFGKWPGLMILYTLGTNRHLGDLPVLAFFLNDYELIMTHLFQQFTISPTLKKTFFIDIDH